MDWRVLFQISKTEPELELEKLEKYALVLHFYNSYMMTASKGIIFVVSSVNSVNFFAIFDKV